MPNSLCSAGVGWLHIAFLSFLSMSGCNYAAVPRLAESVGCMLAQQKFVSRLLSQRENIVDIPFLEIWKIFVAAQTKGAKYLERLMCSGDVVQYDLVQRHDAVLRRANDYSDGNKVTKFRTYIY